MNIVDAYKELPDAVRRIGRQHGVEVTGLAFDLKGEGCIVKFSDGTVGERIAGLEAAAEPLLTHLSEAGGGDA